jgi:uncharacterized protein (DUF1697 family)
MATWVLLLRAVNLGSTNKVSMPVLRERMAEAGFTDVRTYVQSGNIVAASKHRSEATVARDLHDLIPECFGVDTPVIVRTPAQIAAVRAKNPFPDEVAAAEKLVAVVFFAKPLPPGEAIVDFAASVGEKVLVDGRELYIAYSRSVHESKLTAAAMRKHLGLMDGTGRNWRTVTAVADLAAGQLART